MLLLSSLLWAVVSCVVASNEDFAMEGAQYSLTCTGPGTVQYWLLNGEGKAYLPGVTSDTISVTSDGTLRFEEVSVEHAGSHLCVTKTVEEIKGTSVAMRVRPLPPSDPWAEMYSAQFVTAIVSALICAFIFTAGCLVFKYRYREPKSDKELLREEEGGHVNPALEVDGDSTKM